MRRLTVQLLLAALGCACGLPIHQGLELAPGTDRDADAVEIQFLGVGGFLMRRGDDAILTAPLYSNPGLLDLAPDRGDLRPDVDAIDRWHPQAPDVKAIFVGHAHYDHLMDVPWIWQETPEAIVYGNESMARILNGYVVNAGGGMVPQIPADRIRALNRAGESVVDYRMCVQREGPLALASAQVDRNEATGRWVDVPGSRIRFRALCSEHFPQVLRLIHLWPGVVHRPRFAPPTSSRDYQQGETIAYLIDFLDADGDPVFRVYYQDAPTPPTIGAVDPELLAEKDVDVALLCVGSFFEVDDPVHIVRSTRPRVVLLGHWENFLEPPRKRPSPIPFASVGRVIDAVQAAAGPDTEVYLPDLLASYRFESASR